jgi:hypothetical protein
MHVHVIPPCAKTKARPDPATYVEENRSSTRRLGVRKFTWTSLANALVGRLVERHALTLAFDDVFRVMAFLFLAALIMVPLCKPPSLGGPPAALDAH